MAKEITDAMYKKLVASLKKDPGNSMQFYADASGVPYGQINSVLFKAELEADPWLKIPATAKAVVAARNKGLRWPRIATYAGVSVGKAKELYEEGSGQSAAESYTGLGRKFTGSGTAKRTGVKTTTSKRGAASTAKRGTSGRRGAKKTATASTAASTAARRRGGKRGAAKRGAVAIADPK